MGNDGLKSSSSSKHNNLRQPAAQQSKDDDDIEFSKPQSRMNKIRRSLSFRKKNSHFKNNSFTHISSFYFIFIRVRF